MATPQSPPDRGESPGSDVSPLTMPDGNKTTYFAPLTNPRLDTITEHHEPKLSPKPEIPASESVKRPQATTRISFHEPKPDRTGEGPRRGSLIPRSKSPPKPTPSSQFNDHISFDNFSNAEPTPKNTISFTLHAKHSSYVYKKRSRTFMVGIDENTYSNYALQWMIEEMVDDGDEIVCLRVLSPDTKLSNDKNLGKKKYRQTAEKLLGEIQGMNHENLALSIIVEFAVGKLHQTFMSMIQLYEPCMLIVGTKGRSLGGIQSLVTNRNSFSKWCLQNSPIPIVVARSEEKRDKKKAKRTLNPARQTYTNILDISGQLGVHDIGASPRGSVANVDLIPALTPESEASLVASALALPARFDPLILPSRGKQQVRRMSEASAYSVGSASTDYNDRMPESAPTSPGAAIKSPRGPLMESPQVSDEESGDESEGELEVDSANAALQHENAEKQRQMLHKMDKEEGAYLGRSRKDSLENEAD